MKKLIIVLIAMIGFAFAAKAQSCYIGDDTYVSVNAYVEGGKIKCTAKSYGEGTPTSGTVYATVYYIDGNAQERSEMIAIQWSNHSETNLCRCSCGIDSCKIWEGQHTNVAMITKWETSAGACRIERKE